VTDTDVGDDAEMKRAHALSVGLALAAVASVALSCTSATGNTAQQGPAGKVVPGLERFYSQKLSWGGCSTFATTPEDQKPYANPDVQCTYLEVPLDYAKPNDKVVKVGLLRRLASDPSQRIGSLVINPGGPGGSGMSAAASRTDLIGNNELGRRFDFVGFDPRGVGSSTPQVQCLDAAGRDAKRLMNLNVDSSPEGVARTENHERAENAECESRTGKDVLANIGTREVVRDLDVMRSALGDVKLTYLGYSYGTRIGYSYAESFPGNVRAMILDGALDPAQDSVAQLIDQGRGFQQAFDAFAAWCAGRAECALGQDKSQAVRNFQARVRPLINNPVGVPDGRKLSYTDATIGTVQALYVPQLWTPLNRGLQELAQGRGDVLMRLADLYNGRSPDGTYSSQMDTFQAVLCVDNPAVTDPNMAREIDAKYRAAAPFLDTGQPASPALDNCAFWPVPPTGGPHHPQVDGLPPVVVISTTQDPATPYQAGVNLASDLKARLLTFEGTQHTAFLQGIGCVDRAGIAYLVDLKLPPEGIRCQPAG
jgi:pimeloyl-ACP methyl ester carboxylesterase